MHLVRRYGMIAELVIPVAEVGEKESQLEFLDLLRQYATRFGASMIRHWRISLVIEEEKQMGQAKALRRSMERMLHGAHFEIVIR